MATDEIIDISTSIVVSETKITLSNEKLRSIMLKTYERAQQDTSAPKFYKSYGVFFSIAGTLLPALLTSTFHSICGVDAYYVNMIAIIICAGSGLLGILFLAMALSAKTKNDTKLRDKAIDMIYEENVLN